MAMSDGRKATPITATLLVLQMVAAVAVPLAHAGEPESAPAAIEAHHDASCLMLHDAMRCTLCVYFNSLITPPPPPLRIGARASTPAQPAPLAAPLGMRSAASVASQPRAPPLSRS
jgi:hypothetical protein